MRLAPTPSLPPLSKEDYPKVLFWRRSDFTKANSGNGVSNNGGPNPRGGTLISQGINTTGRYIEKETGEIVDGFQLTAICKFAARLWFGYVERGIAPSKWSHGSAEVMTIYNNEMCRRFPELRLCADNWKAQLIATTNYSSWYKTHGKGKQNGADSSIKKEKHPREDSESPPPSPAARKKIKLDDEGLLSFNPLWDPTADPSIDIVSALSTEGISTPMPGALPPCAAPAQLAEELQLPENGQRLAIDNLAPPAAPVTPETAVVVTAATLAFSLPDTTNDATEAAAANAALILSAFPPQTPLAPPAPAVPAVVAALPGKPSAKGSKMIATKSFTARNQCAREWVAKHPGGLRTTFAAYWDSIVGTEEERHWNVAAAQAKATAATNTALAIA
ncbi:hypothetical protein C8J57DRAFT_1674757 [Mycena rebaudengoi]|nr:hypothetical protein C8J57DRAFT_1674757 [Mycena rebaudengoi]